MNDMTGVPRNGKIVSLTAAVAENLVNLAQSSKGGRVPVRRVVIKSTGTMQYGWSTGGPYWPLAANEVKELGGVGPGDDERLWFIRVGGADVPFVVEIYN